MKYSGLNVYNGEWTKKQIVHLLKRTMFGANNGLIKKFGTLTLSACVDFILQNNSQIDLPLNNYNSTTYTDPTGVLFGQTWINSDYGDGTVNAKRRYSLQEWWQLRLVNANQNIEEKLLFFWHNHFSTQISVVSDARIYFNYISTLRKYSLGNFKQMTKAISIDAAMLRYLNGSQNTVTAPDENYGRELQELFTVGKGPNSKYTENDVKEMARGLTGYQIDPATLKSFFNSKRHDSNSKQFSAFYNNQIIKGRQNEDGVNELDDLLNMIFANNEVANFICSKIYKFFVNSDITAAVQTEIIDPLAVIFRSNNYEIKPVLKALFQSQHFFDEAIKGSIIKTPLDLTVGSYNEFNGAIASFDTKTMYQIGGYFQSQALGMSLELGEPPNVAGWPAYYQAPQFYETWINSDTLPKRNVFTDSLSAGITLNANKIGYDFLNFTKQLANPGSPDDLINEVIEILFQIDVDTKVKSEIKGNILLDGQTSDYYWTNAWNDYISKPTATTTNVVLTKLKKLYQYLMEMPEYQLM